MSESKRMKMSSDRRFCTHCNQLVSKRTYFRHREMFGSSDTSTWEGERDSSVVVEGVIHCSDDPLDTEEVEEEISTSSCRPISESDSEWMDEHHGNDNENSEPEEATASDNQDSYDTETMVTENNESSSEEEESSSVEELKENYKWKPILQFFLFLFHWQVAFNISTAAVTSVLKFLKFFLSTLAALYSNKELAIQADKVPLTLKTVCSMLNLNDPGTLFTKYAVCSKCSTIYELQQCLIQKANGTLQAKTCTYVQYPCHPQPSRRLECGGNLIHTIYSKNGLIHRPIRVYPYQSLLTSLSRLAASPGFLTCCEQWRKRPDYSRHGYLCDVYDGNVWKDFIKNGFLEAPYNYLLTLNVDWFSPFERSIYSLGAIYLTIQNLPRSIRYHPDNIILVGLIPGPKEPKLTINSFLGPLITELQEAWTNGIKVKSPNGAQVTLRVAVSCVACDIPATRKVCGFLGHRSTLACNKCLKHFQQMRDEGVNWTNFSGFDRSLWPPRVDEDFIHKCKTSFTKEKCNTQSATKSLESTIGGRYSVLLGLPYFLPVRFSVIDPMHNLFLGTGKHMMEVWLATNTLTMSNLLNIEEKSHMYILPDGIGRLPSNISSKFGGFTADQWRNWIVVYSPVLLKECIEGHHWRCWMLFVSACKAMISRTVRQADIKEADRRLSAFCQQACALYGEKYCTMNMHLHLHLKTCIEDYGSTSGFWLYAFERYNGMLGSYHTNNKSVESQVMKGFLRRQSLHKLTTDPFLHDPNFIATLPSSSSMFEVTYYENFQTNIVHLLELPLGEISITPDVYKLFSSKLTPIGPFKEKFLSSEQFQSVNSVANLVFGPDVQLHRSYLQFGRITICDDLLGSCLPRSSHNSSTIVANWPIDESAEAKPVQAIGEIQYFLKTKILFTSANPSVETSSSASTSLDLVLAYVHWYKKHRNEKWYGSSFSVCDHVAPKIINSRSFLPLQRITARCAHIRLNVDFGDMTEDVFVACHLPLQFNY